jgi:hypothetical protein
VSSRAKRIGIGALVLALVPLAAADHAGGRDTAHPTAQRDAALPGVPMRYEAQPERATGRYEHDGDGVCAARGVYVDNAEQVSYWVDSDGNGHLWTFTEYANRRMLVRIYTNEYNDPPSGCPTQ